MFKSDVSQIVVQSSGLEKLAIELNHSRPFYFYTHIPFAFYAFVFLYVFACVLQHFMTLVLLAHILIKQTHRLKRYRLSICLISKWKWLCVNKIMFMYNSIFKSQ